MGYRVDGLTKGVTQLLSLLTEVRYSPFYTYDLAFEALVDTLQTEGSRLPAHRDQDLYVLAEIPRGSRDR